MQRPWRIVPMAGVVTTALVLGPMLAGIALGADPITVRPGDTLTGISRRTGVPVAALVRINDLADANRIYAGQRLRVSAPRPRPAARAAASRPARTHLVRPGEHLTGIARRYGTTVARIVAANRIANPSRIHAGQRLTIPRAGRASHAPARPRPAARAAARPGRRIHIVRGGEHLTGIAQRYRTTIGTLVALNGLVNASHIYAGQRLVVPSGPVHARRTAARPSPAMPASMRDLMASRRSVRAVIASEARRYRVPIAFALAVAWQESGWQQGVTSHAGAIGVMQIMPATGRWVGEAMLGRRVDLRSTRANVRVGVRLLRHYLDRYDGDLNRVLAAYYQGQTAVDRHGVYPVSWPYIASIRAIARMLAR